MSKICSKCGGVLEDDAGFCQFCGDNQGMNYNNVQPTQTSNQQYYAPVQPYDDHTSIGGWIGWLLLSSFLPIIGMVIAICCSKDKSVKNWAIASFIISAIMVVLVIVIAVAGVTLFESTGYMYY